MSLLRQRQRPSLAGELLAIIFMGLIAEAAHKTEVTLLLFPELAALSHDVLTRPQGKWAIQPLRLILTPTLTAVVGLLVTRHAHYGAIPVLLTVLAGLAIIRLLRSSIGPALSAGVLPMILDERHWMYPVAICIGLTGLVLLLWTWQRYGAAMDALEEQLTDASIDVLETNPTGRFWLFHLLGFVLVLSAAGQWTGLRFILFPPLVVMAYEILGHPKLPGWMKRPALFPVACFLTASVGVLASRSFLSGVTAVVVTVVVSILLLRLFRMHMPPALAVGLLPFVMTAPDGWYPVSVALGTSTLAVFFLGCGWLMRHGRTRRDLTKSFRGRGIKRQLLLHGEAEIAERGYETLRLRVVKSNTRALAFYKRSGWHPVREFSHETLPFINMMELSKIVDGIACTWCNERAIRP